MQRKMPLFLCTMAVLVLCGLMLCFLGKRDFSELENRPLATWPEASMRTLTDGSFGEEVETYAADHFPFRDALISTRSFLHLVTGDCQQLNTLSGRDGWLFELPPDTETRTASLSVETLSDICQALRKPGFLMIIPTSAAVMGDALPSLYTCGSQEPVIASLSGKAASMTTVDSTLFDHVGDDSLYYRTDHHLTAAGAALCYHALCKAWSLTPSSDFSLTTVEGFRGSYYAKLPSPSIPAEVFSVYLPENVRVTLDEQSASGFFTQDALEKRNKYAALLGGTYAHAVLENDGGTGSLLILSDSYANAIAPMLAAHFRRIDLIDPRYFTCDLSALVDEAGTDTMLALFGLNTLSTNRSVLLMDVPEGSNQ